MRLLKFVLLFALIPTFTYAQRGGGGHGGGGGHAMGGGGGFHGGGGTAGGGFRGGSIGGGFRGGSVGGGFRGGYGGYGGFRGGYGGYYGRGYYGGFGLGLGLGWGWPYYAYYPYYSYGYPYGYYDYGYPDYNAAYDDSYPAYGNDYGYISGTQAPQAPQSGPPVVIQNYGAPASPGQQQSFYRAPDFYLIAFTDHTIQAAISFHVEGDQIFWTTREHVERHAPLSTVDRSFSAQINRDRRVQFNLP